MEEARLLCGAMNTPHGDIAEDGRGGQVLWRRHLDIVKRDANDLVAVNASCVQDLDILYHAASSTARLQDNHPGPPVEQVRLPVCVTIQSVVLH